VLAIICVIFGVFADHVPLKYFIFPATAGVSFAGNWQAGLSALLILVGLALGLLFLNVKGLIKPAIRYDEPFVGAETLNLEENRVTGAEFYNTVGDIGILKAIYSKAEAGFFDIYEQGKNIVFGIGRFLQYLHNGVLPTYLVWSLLGMMGLFWALMR
jgi:hypothetical protein